VLNSSCTARGLVSTEQGKGSDRYHEILIPNLALNINSPHSMHGIQVSWIRFPVLPGK
jgi:hypothetical protein